MTVGTITQMPHLVIASDAKQSRLFPRKERLDCFVAALLAMTESAEHPY